MRSRETCPGPTRFARDTFETPDISGKPWGDAVDVRDCAIQHVLALEILKAGGERIISTSTTWAWQDVCEHLAFILIDRSFDRSSTDDILNASGYPSPTKGNPGTGVLAQAQLSGTKINIYSNAKSLQLFQGFVYRDFETGVRELGKQSLEQGWF